MKTFHFQLRGTNHRNLKGYSNVQSDERSVPDGVCASLSKTVLHSTKVRLFCTLWWSPLTHAKTVGERREPLSLHELLSTGRHLLRDSLRTSLKLHLCTAPTTQNIRENKCIISHSALAQFIFKHNTSSSGHRQRTVAFAQSKTLPIPTANSTVNMCQGVAWVLLWGSDRKFFLILL
jgi:hypothetical protein